MKKLILSEKLKSYSLLAGSIFASSYMADGQVKYTDVEPDIQLGGVVPSTYPDLQSELIDLNNDGTFDFNITVNITGEGAQAGAYSFLEKIDGYQNPSNIIRTNTIEYVPFAAKINCGDLIPVNNFYGFHYANFAFQFNNSASYNWDNLQDKCVGVMFKIGSESHYGWIRLDVNNGTVPGIVIKSFAFEETANKKIAACDTGFPVNVLEPVDVNDQLSLFPNPSTGNCIIKIEQPLSGDYEFSLNDALGRILYQSVISMDGSKKELPFDFSFFTPGIYLIQLSAMPGMANTKPVSFSQKWIKL